MAERAPCPGRFGGRMLGEEITMPTLIRSCSIVVLLIGLAASATAESSDGHLDLAFDNATISEVLVFIRDQGGLGLAWSSDALLDDDGKPLRVSIHGKGLRPAMALQAVCFSARLDFRRLGDNLYVIEAPHRRRGAVADDDDDDEDGDDDEDDGDEQD